MTITLPRHLVAIPSTQDAGYMQYQLFLFVHDHQKPTQLKTKQSQQSHTNFGFGNPNTRPCWHDAERTPKSWPPYCCRMRKVRHEIKNADCHECWLSGQS